MFYFHKVAYVHYLGEVDIFSYMSKTFLPLYNSAKIIKIDRDFSKLWSQMYCHLFYGSQCTSVQKILRIRAWLPPRANSLMIPYAVKKTFQVHLIERQTNRQIDGRIDEIVCVRAAEHPALYNEPYNCLLCCSEVYYAQYCCTRLACENGTTNGNRPNNLWQSP